jgi:P4 family phage/plasmid primase-like protien
MDFITCEDFIKDFETEQELAAAFKARNERYKFSNNYFYEYDDDIKLWKIITVDDIITSMSIWITHNVGRYIAKKASNNKLVDELIDIKKKYTKYQYLKNVVSFFKVSITDKDFTIKLDRTLNDHLPIRNNKIINLRDGTVRYRTQEDYFTYFCDVEPTEEKSPLFNDFISQIMCNNKENIEYLQKILGYCISGETSSQCFYLFYGTGSNGKSLLLKLLQKILNTAYKTSSKKIFINSGKDAGAELVDIKNARLLTFSETKKNDNLNDDIIKSISGNDQLTARGLYSNPISFNLICKLILCTNYKPNFDGTDKAMVRRLKYIGFLASFVDEPTQVNQYKINRDLENKLLEKKYIDEFFTFCLEGAIKWYNEPKFNPPKEIKEETDNYILSQNSVEKWFLERVEKTNPEILNKYKKLCKSEEIDEKDFNEYKKYCIKNKIEEPIKEIDLIINVDRSDCFNDYNKFCDDNGITPVRKKELFENLPPYMNKCVKSNGIWIYKGYRLKEEEKEEEKKEEPKNSLDL